MAYMSRLGIWGLGTQFPNFQDFIKAVERRYSVKVLGWGVWGCGWRRCGCGNVMLRGGVVVGM